MTHPLTSTFMRMVADELADSPFTFSETAEGFDVSFDVFRERWASLFRQHELTEWRCWHVAVQDTGSFVITEDIRTLQWESGYPAISTQVKRVMGRTWQTNFEKVYGRRDDGTYGELSSTVWSPPNPRESIVRIGKGLGLTNRMNVYESIAIGAATIAIGGLLILGGGQLLAHLLR